MKNIIFTILAAGALGTVSFDAFGQGLSPLLGYAKLAPVGLAQQTLGTVFESVPKGAADLLHAFTGVVIYTLGYLLVARPIQNAVLPQLPWIATATAYGVGLWVFALYVMAHLVAGNPAFLGFTGITWVALWGHVVYAIVMAWVVESRGLSLIRAKSTPAMA